MKTPLFSALRQAFQLAQQNPKNTLSVEDVLENYQQRQYSRRQFLRSTGQAGLVLGVGSLLGNTDLMPLLYGKNLPKIAIVGGGIAGLSAAYYLREKGIAATIYEADKRMGGRIKSARIFDNGKLNTEIGAEFIDTGHLDMRRFAKILNLESTMMDVNNDTFGQRDAFYFENKHHSVADIIKELQGFYPTILADRKKLGGRHAAELDQISMADYIDKMPVSPWVKKMIEAAFIGENGMETSQQSAANLLGIFAIEKDEFLPFGDSDERFKITGGNDQIPLGLAKLVQDQIRLEHKLMAVKENANKTIQLTFSQNGATKTDTFDAVIMAIPFTILRDVEFTMELHDLKRQVIKELSYGTNTKFILETKERTWRKDGYRGYLFNEQIHNGWDCSQMQQNDVGVGAFTVFYGGDWGKNCAKGTEQQQLNHVLPALEGAFPGTKASLTGKMEIAQWPANPFIKASYSCYSVGQVSRFEGAAFEPVRRLYFAGEHCSIDYWGFMNGGAETGRLAAQKLMKKMRVR